MLTIHRFSVFFSNDKFDTAGAQQIGFDGFFRGAFSYHFHNFWYVPRFLTACVTDDRNRTD